MDYIKNSLEKYPQLFRYPADVLEHLLCTNGNGVTAETFGPKELVSYEYNGSLLSYEQGGFTLSKEMFELLPATPLRSLYGWSTDEEFQPFRKYTEITIPENMEGMKAAVRYFLKCLSITNGEALPDHEQNPWLEDYYQKALADWKANAHVLREVFDL